MKKQKVLFISAPAIIVVGILISVIAFNVIRGIEKEELIRDVERRITLYVLMLEQVVHVDIEALKGLNSLFKASSFVSRKEFSTFAIPIIQTHNSLHALEWIPKITENQRPIIRINAINDGLVDFNIKLLNKQKQLVVSTAQTEYFPVFYVEPIAGNENAVGFDLASNAIILKTLEQSRDSGNIIATAPIDLVQFRNDEKGILLFNPLYIDSPTNQQQRRHQLQGFTLGVYRINSIFNKAYERTKQEMDGMITAIFFGQPSKKSQPLYIFSDKNSSDKNSPYRLEKTFEIAGKTFTLSSIPSNKIIEQSFTNQPLFVALSIMLFTLMTSSYTFFSGRREQYINRLIVQRTKALAFNERNKQTILDTAANAIVTINQQGEIKQFNLAAQKLFGYKDSEALNKNVKLLMPSPYHDEHDGYLNRYLSTQEAHIIGIGREVVGLRKDGSTFPMELSIGEARIGDELLFVGVIVDITYRKNTEQALIAAKNKAEESNVLKTDFLNLMSHELRTPLTTIIGYTPVLKRPRDQISNEIYERIISNIDSSGQHLMTLINDILDISKIEAGKMTLNKQWINAADVINNILENFNLIIEEKKLLIINDITDINVFVDAMRFKQIIINLIGNALKYTNKGNIKLSKSLYADKVEFYIEDTGIGIIAEELPFIFEKFKRVDSSSTRETSGTGLGLAITKKLIELHQGEIRVTSTLNQGSTFSFTLPTSEENTNDQNTNC